MSFKEKFDMVKKAKELQKKLRSEVVTVTAGAVRLVINGEQKVQEVSIDKDLVDPENMEKLEREIKSAIEQAITKSQAIAANIAKGMGIGF
ncbi:MAG: DNA-binding protein [candidate division CPR2 bacterium GW2011_GWC1_39_9]|uniref:DNA-binding protein n=1 Tax=candidate division CPR2 bacterium GW2011_GWC2_39_10 TaxID=1618345 RepID=A0A0G0LV06_UNCC2|nr:MAG: DNA-binding protein [candidate division CPR2 bacterium GW2011_GWC2_39_10]KKR34527.1 MAG: DNA-binding protein [candidate division CPR2 bacterium GW2011_GWC1_39_9]